MELSYWEIDLSQNQARLESVKKQALEIIEKIQRGKDTNDKIDEDAIRELKKTITRYEYQFQQSDLSETKDALKSLKKIALDHINKEHEKVDVDKLILDKAIGGLETIEKQQETIATYEQTIDEQRDTINQLRGPSYTQMLYPDETLKEQKSIVRQLENLNKQRREIEIERRAAEKTTSEKLEDIEIMEAIIVSQEEAITSHKKSITYRDQTITDRDQTVAKLRQIIKDKDDTIVQLKKQLAGQVGDDKGKPALRKSKRIADTANSDKDKASISAPPNKESHVDSFGLSLTFATEVYFFDRAIFSSDISANGLNYLQDSVVTINKGQEKSSFLTKFSASVRSATPGVIGAGLDSLVFTWQDLNEAGPGFYEVNNHDFNDYIQEQKWKLVNGMVPGVRLNGELGTKIIFFHKADRALAREGFLRVTPTK